MTDVSLTVEQFEALVDLLDTGLDADAVAIVDDIDALVNATGDLSAAASVTIDGAATVDQIQTLETALAGMVTMVLSPPPWKTDSPSQMFSLMMTSMLSVTN